MQRTFSDLRRLQAFCAYLLGPPAGDYYRACYIPAMDLVAIPGARAWPSRHERAALRAHEWAHARGWRHERGVRVAASQRWQTPRR